MYLKYGTMTFCTLSFCFAFPLHAFNLIVDPEPKLFMESEWWWLWILQVPYKFSRTKGQKAVAGECSQGKNEQGITVHVPWRYRKIEIKYGKHGMDDFDYDQYNRTSFSGLDMSLPNSYCNPMLQVSSEVIAHCIGLLKVMK